MNHDFMDDIVSFHMELDSIVKLSGWNKSPEKKPSETRPGGGGVTPSLSKTDKPADLWPQC